MLNDVLFWSALAGVPALALSFARAVANGWQPELLEQLLVLGLVWLLWLGRAGLSYGLRAGGMLLALWLVAFAGQAQGGHVVVGGAFFILFAFFAAIFLPGRVAWPLIAGNAACLGLTGLADCLGWLPFSAPGAPAHAGQPATWGLLFWSLAASGTILALAGQRMMRELAGREHEARELDSRLRMVAANVPGVIYQFLMRPEGTMRLQYVSEGVERIFGVRAESLLGDAGRAFELIHPEDVAGVREAILASARDMAPSQQTFRIRRPGQGVIWVERFSTPERLENGDILWHGFLSDITPIKAAEGQLAATLENAPGIAAQWYDRDGRVLYWNHTSETLYGWTRTEAAGRTIDQLMASPEQALEFREMLNQVARDGGVIGPVDWRLRHRDGLLLIVSSTLFQLASAASPVFVCLDVDVTGRKKAEAELLQAKELAESANHAKSSFLAGMSHELRTPLNAIVGFAQLLQMDGGGNLRPDQRDSVGHILNSSQHLLDLINEVLDLARIEEGYVHLVTESLLMLPLIDEVVALLQPEAAGRQVVLQRTCADATRAVGDVSRIRQVLFNLISNAIKYNRPGGSVTVTCSVVGGSVRIAVADTGQGIAEDRLGQVFQPFQRLGAEQGPVDGTGIGLVVSKRLVEAMHGRIGFESTPGVGSRFWFELPSERRSQDRSEPWSGLGALQVQEPVAGVRGHVLYIEDNPVNAKVMQHIFRLLPEVDLLVAETAEDGLQQVARKIPDLVLMDLGLPGMSGYEALAILKGDPETARIPIIAVSASAMAQDVAHGLEAGFLDYLTKPIDVPAFLSRVRTLLGDDPGSASDIDAAGGAG